MSVWDKFSKHGLPGLVIAALLYLVVTFHQDSVITVREVTVSAYQLRNAVEKQTVVLDQLSQLIKEPKYDTVYNTKPRTGSLTRDSVVYGERERSLADKVQGSVPSGGGPFWVAKER